MDYLKPKSARRTAKGAGVVSGAFGTDLDAGNPPSEQDQVTGRPVLPMMIDGLVAEVGDGLSPITVPTSTPTSSDPAVLIGQVTALTSFLNQKTGDRDLKREQKRLAIGRRRQILSPDGGRFGFPAYAAYLGFSINDDDTTNPVSGFREGSARFSTALGRDAALEMAGGNAADIVELDPARGPQMPAVFGVVIGRNSSTNSLRRGYALEYTEARRALGNANPPEPPVNELEGIVHGRASTLRSLLGETLLIRFIQAQIDVLNTAINAATAARTAVQNKLTSLSAARPTLVGLVGIPGGSAVTFNGAAVPGGSWEGGREGGTWLLPATPGQYTVVVTPVSGGAKRANVVVIAENRVDIRWSDMVLVEQPTLVGLVGIPGGSTVTFNRTVVTGGDVGAGRGAWEGGEGGTWVLPASPGELTVVVTPRSGGAKRAVLNVLAGNRVNISWAGMELVEQPTRIGIAGMPPGSTVSINGTVVTGEPIANGVYGIAAAAGQATVVVTPPGGRARTKTINVIGGVTGVIEFGDMAEAQQGGQQGGQQGNAGPVGTIRISGTQHGKVAVDGVIYGETNSTHKLTPVFENGALAGFDILGVSAGGHVVAFLGANDEPYARHPVVVRAGERTRVDFTPPPPVEHDFVEPVGPLRPREITPVIVSGPPTVPVRSGMSTATMVAIALAVAVGGYYLYNKRK